MDKIRRREDRELTLYRVRHSTNVERVALALAHKGLRAESVWVPFEDRSEVTGLAMPSMPYTAFGAAWIDYDNDGWLDLLVANGAVQAIEALARANDPYPLEQRNQLFRNLGNGRFEDKS